MTDTTPAGASTSACLVPANDTEIGLIRAPDVAALRELPTVGMPLHGLANSPAAIALTRRLTNELTKGQALHGRDNLPLAVAAIIYDLLGAAEHEPLRACYRPMKCADFIGKRITHDPAKRALDLLERHGFIIRHTGRSEKRGWGENTVTRIEPTIALLRLAADFGIAATNRGEHFTRQIDPVPLTKTIKLNAASKWCGNTKFKGKQLAVDFSDPLVTQLAQQVDRINRFTFAQRIEGTDFLGFYRGFNLGNLDGHDFQKGGRLYAYGGQFQQMPKKDRPLIRINGEPTVEVDIGSSHLSIFLANAGVGFNPADDLYQTPDYDRRVIKAFINLTISLPRIPKAWPDEMVQDYRDDRNDPFDLMAYPIGEIREHCFKLHPILRYRKDYLIDWADIQFIESRVIIDSVELLNQRGITALPIHDSLIVPSRFNNEVTSIIKERFKLHVGFEPRIK